MYWSNLFIDEILVLLLDYVNLKHNIQNILLNLGTIQAQGIIFQKYCIDIQQSVTLALNLLWQMPIFSLIYASPQYDPIV